MKLVPVINTNSQEDLERKLYFLEGKIDSVQIDVVDGKFAERRTFPLEWLDKHQERGFFWELHLMVKNPFSWVEKSNFVMAQRVIGQIEEMGDQLDFIDRTESEVMEAGLALEVKTGIDQLGKEALFRSSAILLLAVETGYSGRDFDPEIYKKIDELLSIREETGADFEIIVDGGVGAKNISLLKERGVDQICVGSAIWESKDWEKTFFRLKNLAK